MTMAMMIMMLMMMLVTLLVTHTRAEGGQCEEIQIPMCKDIGYNFTRLPNEFNHESQDEVSAHFNKETTRLFIIQMKFVG